MKKQKQVFKDKDTFWAIVNPCGGWGLCYGNAGDINNGLGQAEKFYSAKEAERMLKEDSVFQIAAHESIVPSEKLYEYCRIARKILVGKFGVGRVIARPFEGEWPYSRTSRRHDYSLEPNVHMSPDQKWVIFRANFEGYDNIYAVELKK